MSETTGTPDGTASVTSPPPAPATKKSEEARKRREPKSRKRVYVVVAITLALFAGLAAWISTRPMPYVTHREILLLATAIEATKSSEQMLRHFDAELFRGLPPNIAQIVSMNRDDPSITYTFLTVADERTQRPRLLFRVHKSFEVRMGIGGRTTVIDYQEMVAGRRGDAVKVTDFRSVAVGDMWWTAMRDPREGGPPPATPTMAALREAVDAKNQTNAVKAFQALPPEERALVAARATLLSCMDTADADGFLTLSREVRTWLPENLAPPFRVLFDAQFAPLPLGAQLRQDVREAIGRIQVRIPDDMWLGAFMRAMTAVPPDAK